MKKTILLTMTLIILLGNQTTQAQESVSETIKFADRCLNKVKKRRFNLLKENYSKAIKDIENIKTKAEQDLFGYDNVVQKAPNWIRMMNRLAKFPDHQLAFKEDAITFEITDYKPLLAEAKVKANEAHYQAGVKIMEENKDNFNARKGACDHFIQAMEFSDNYKEDMLERGAQIYYDEGLRIFTEHKGFSGKRKCEEHFLKALKWKKPYKDINQLMAKLYFDEAERLAATEEPENWKTAIPLYGSADRWEAGYQDCASKLTSLRTKGANYYYDKAKAEEEIHEYAAQAKAAEYYNECSEWVKDYLGAEKLAMLAKKRSTVRVFYYKAPKFINPASIKNPLATAAKSTEDLQNAAKDSKLYSHFEFPWKEQYKLISGYLPQETPNLAQNDLDGGGILVVLSKMEDPTYQTTSPRETHKEVVTYTAKYPDEEAKLIPQTVYLLGLEANKRTYTADFKKHTGSVTTRSESISVAKPIVFSFYDLREPDKSKFLGLAQKSMHYTHSVTNEFYEGDPWAKPNNLQQDGPVKTKLEMFHIIEKKTNNGVEIFNQASEEIGAKLKQDIKYYHIEN